MTCADKIAEAKALIPDAQEIAAERREKATESRAVASMSGYAGRPAAGWLMAADYAERTANVLDRFAALADLADAQAQEIARQAQRVEQLEFALRRLSTDEAPDWVRSIAYSEIGDAP